MGDTIWGYADHEEAESYSGRCASREAAITEARNEYGEGVPVWVVEGAIPDPAKWIPDDARFISNIAAAAFDECGDIADDYPSPSAEASAELEALLAAWARKHITPTFWMANGHAERVDPPAGEKEE